MKLERVGAAVMLALSVAMPAGVLAGRNSAPVKATIAVTNQNPLDVDVFILAGGTKARLGTVVTSQTQEFDLPVQAVNAGPVRVSADPIGTRTPYTSEPLSVSDGDRIRLTVSPQLAQSTVTVERIAVR